MSKVCFNCKQTLPINAFYKHKQTKDKLNSICKKCESLKKKTRYLKLSGKESVSIWRHTIDICHKHAASKNGICLSTEYFGNKEKYHWKCACGHEWIAILSKNKWCPKCANSLRKETKYVKYGSKTFNNRNKAKETCLIRYGAKNSMQNTKVALKNAKSQNNSSILFHWKTKEELVCRGSYEQNVVHYFNKNKINFDWQIPFTLSDGRIYIIDLLDKDRDIFIEIKGYWRGDGKEKYELFKKDFPNLVSEVWDKSILSFKGISTLKKKEEV